MRMYSTALGVALAAGLAARPVVVYAQDAGLAEEPDAVAESAVPLEGRSYNPWLVGGFTVGLAGSLLAAGYVSWWDDGEFIPFAWRETGWLGPKATLGGGDKAGHFFTFYAVTRGTAGSYRALGLEPGTAELMAAGFAVLLSTTIETVDGFTTYGFEYADVIANVLGISLGVLLDSVPVLDGLFGVRMGYVPSPAYVRGELGRYDGLSDYDGQVVHLDLRLAGLSRFGVPLGPLRFVTLGVSWGTDGYITHDDVRRRNLGAFVGVNLSELILATDGDEHAFPRAVATFTRYYAVPFTEVSFESDLEGGDHYLGFGVANRLEVPLDE